MDLIKEIYSDLKSGFRWLVKLSPKVKKQKYWMYGFIGLVLLVFFLISQSQKENGLTDWISALANVVMAGAAIIGVVFAGNWKNEATTNKVIELGGDFFQVILNNLRFINANPIVLKDMGFILSSARQYKVLTAYNAISLYLQATSFIELSEKSKVVYRDFHSNNDKINHLGWVVKERYKDNHKDMLDNAYFSWELSLFVISDIKRIFQRMNYHFDSLSVSELENTFTSVDLSIYPELDDLMKQIDGLLLVQDKLNSNVHNILVPNQDSPSIFDYFGSK